MKNRIFLDLTLLVLTTAFLASPSWAAGPLDSPAPATDQASAMYNTMDVYNRLHSGSPGPSVPGLFSGPAAGPASTGKTLDQIMAEAPTADNAAGAAVGDVKSGRVFWGLRTDGGWGRQTGSFIPAPVARSGQVTSYAAGDDGATQKGVPWPAPRFIDNGNGTVTDKLTGLIWLKNANCFGLKTWTAAFTSVASLSSGGCGLSDGSALGDWRLPQVREMKSLEDKGKSNPALPAGHPFTGVLSSPFWSSTTNAGTTANAWTVNLASGLVTSAAKTGTNYLWPVRGGQ